MKKQNRNRVADPENRLMAARGERGGGTGWEGEGIRKYKLVITEQSQDVKYSIGHIVNNIVITTCGSRWVLEIWEGHCVKYMII